jgi:hypothetical protein
MIIQYMSTMQFGEVFGHPVTDSGDAARRDRTAKLCPFRGSACTKAGTADPLGICSLSNGRQLATLCPVRFLEGNRVFTDVARLAFGAGADVLVVPEIRVLEVSPSADDPDAPSRKVGKVDFLLVRADATGQPTPDFVALEVQAVYMSGGSMRNDFRSFLQTGIVDPHFARRPDYRSSIQKRLMPQLALKMQAFRTWGKRFFVATDELFFQHVPPIRPQAAYANSEITWFVYPFSLAGDRYQMGDPTTHFTKWADVEVALREGTSTPEAVLAEVRQKLRNVVVRRVQT